MPVWSAISAGGLKSWVPPKGVTDVVVFSDNDSSMVGQLAAYELAQRLTKEKIRVTVRIPEKVDTDWGDL